MSIKLSNQTVQNLKGLSIQIRELQLQFNAILTTFINEKGKNGENYKLSPDFTTLIEEQREEKENGQTL